MNAYITLFIAIIAEVIATSALKSSDSFTKLIPSIVVILGYAIAFYCLSITLRSMQTGVAYAIWSGLGIVLISIASYFLYGQKLDMPAVLGITLIMTGVIIINVFSDTSA